MVGAGQELGLDSWLFRRLAWIYFFYKLPEVVRDGKHRYGMYGFAFVNFDEPEGIPVRQIVERSRDYIVVSVTGEFMTRSSANSANVRMDLPGIR